jgi:hypothetical protein
LVAENRQSGFGWSAVYGGHVGLVVALPGLTIFTYTAEPGSRSEEALKLLGSWAATIEPAEPARAADPS